MRRQVQAVLVNTVERSPGQMLGLAELGGAEDSLLNVVTGGSYQDVLGGIDAISLALKICIATSAIAAIFGAAAFFSSKR